MAAVTLLAGVIALAACAPLLALAAARTRAAHGARRDALRYLGEDGFVRAGGAEAAGERLFAALGRRLTRRGYMDQVRVRLARAGDSRRPERVVAAKALGACAGIAFGLWVAAARPALGALVLASAAPAGFLWPDAALRRRADARAAAIRRALPDSLDLMAILVEAGVGLEGAIARAATDVGGPLADEYRRLIHEISLGASRREAFTALKERIELPEVSVFVLALRQADALGIAVGSVLKTQAGEMRARRRQAARERAARTPVKILFPLVFGIFPALLIVILGPAVIRILSALAG